MLAPTIRAVQHNGQGPPDASQIRSMHQAWVTYAAGNNGVYPTPGLINRQPVMGMQIPGVGAEDQFQNHTAFVHSVCVMLLLYSPDSCVGTTEVSERVHAKTDYNFAAYDPAGDVYWDTTFRADLSTFSNVSYASMPVAGERQTRNWRDTNDSDWTILGNRGPQDGSELPTVYDQSITLQLHGSKKRWVGYECFGDNHCERLTSFRPSGLNYETATGDLMPDNMFKNDHFGSPSSSIAAGTDRWLVIAARFFGTSDHVTHIHARWD
jgi:hypothetical protein